MPGAVVFTVRVTVAVGLAWLIVTLLGVKLQLPPTGIAEQEPDVRSNVPLKPLVEAIVKVNVPELPGGDTVTTGLTDDTVKSGAAEFCAQPLAFTKLNASGEPRPVARS